MEIKNLMNLQFLNLEFVTEKERKANKIQKRQREEKYFLPHVVNIYNIVYCLHTLYVF